MAAFDLACGRCLLCDRPHLRNTQQRGTPAAQKIVAFQRCDPSRRSGRRRGGGGLPFFATRDRVGTRRILHTLRTDPSCRWPPAQKYSMTQTMRLVVASLGVVSPVSSIRQCISESAHTPIECVGILGTAACNDAAYCILYCDQAPLS